MTCGSPPFFKGGRGGAPFESNGSKDAEAAPRPTTHGRLRRLLLAALTFLGVALLWPRMEASSPPPQLFGRLQIAAASGLRFAMEEARAQFAAIHPGLQVYIAYGASGYLHSQLINGAPFDLFLSADRAYAEAIARGPRATLEDLRVFAYGALVLWTSSTSPLNAAKLQGKTLTDPALKRLAIANPRHAPYGKAAEAALKNLGLWIQLQPKLVLGQNVSQTAQFAQTGAAEAGLIALSLAVAPTMAKQGHHWTLPGTLYPPLAQTSLVLHDGKGEEAARAFQHFLTAPAGKTLLTHYGFTLPEGT